MKTFKSDTAIFYNKDCGKYGVLTLEKAYILDDKQLYHWTQVGIWSQKQRKFKTYTEYKTVARRWAKEIVTKGIVEVRADMVNNESGLLPEPLEFVN